MIVDDEVKKKILKTFTNILINVKGKGPQNIYIKYDVGEIKFVIQGILSVYEKYLLRYHDDEVKEILKNLYLMDAENVINQFRDEFNGSYIFEFNGMTIDLENNYFEYRITIGSNEGGECI